MGIFVSVKEKDRNGLKLPWRNWLNTGWNFLTVRGAEIQEVSSGNVLGFKLIIPRNKSDTKRSSTETKALLRQGQDPGGGSCRSPKSHCAQFHLQRSWNSLETPPEL